MDRLKNIFFDTETTGLNPGQIGQLSFIVESNGAIEVAKNYFFAVEHMEEGAESVHHMSKEFLLEKSGGLTFKDLYQEFYPYFRDNRLVAHNLKFDEKFMSSELWRVGISFRPVARQCTMEFFKDVLKIPNKYPKYGPYKNPNLAEVVSYFNINQEKILMYSNQLFGSADITFHDSRFDTTAMYVATNIYREMHSGGYNWRRIFCC